MASSFDSEKPDQFSDVPFEHEALPVEDDAPRRAASARFIVDSEVGADAALRDAMDPANQSLAEALRLSYRVLQVVMLVLVVLFLASGLRTVDEGKSGVRTRWGRIDAGTGAEALSPGLHFSVYPYPVGDFIVFDAENRSVRLNETFMPFSGGRSRQTMLEQADQNTPIFPGRDGALITREGDLAHAEISAQYIIDQPVDFLETVDDSDQHRNGERFVKLAIQRATVQVCAGLGLQDIINRSEDLEQRVRRTAQDVLDDLDCGIQISSVRVQGMAPFAIEKALGDVTAARVATAEQEENARQAASKALQRVAGDQHEQITRLIDEYENALDRNDPQQGEILAQIHANLQAPGVTGEVADILEEARGYQLEIESALSADYQRFASLLPAFRKDPQTFAKQQWLGTFAKVLVKPDTEIIYVDPLMDVSIQLTGSSEVQDIRTKYRLDAKEREVNKQSRPRQPLWGYERSYDQAGRTLVKDKDGKWVPIGTNR